MQVSASKGSAADSEEPGSLETAAGAAKGRAVSAVMKRYLVEKMLPILVELKRLLEARQHPLLGDLMTTLTTLLKDHKAEVWGFGSCCISLPPTWL